MDVINMKDYFEKASQEIKGLDSWIIVQMTDQYLVDKWQEMKDNLEKIEERKVLEIRIFNKDKEMKLFRSDVGKEVFLYRLRDDTGCLDGLESTIDEFQYLDINEDRSKNSFQESNEVYTINGGKFRLPLKNMENAGIVIRHYLDYYEETGQVKVIDWRAVELKNR